MMRKKYVIGELVGANANLIVKDYIRNGRRSKYIVECQVCKLDPELNGDAIYHIASENLSSGKLPCMCSPNPKRTKYQTRILCERKAIENDHEFIGFVGDPEKVDQNVKLQLRCNSCDHEWESCSVANYLRDRGCPSCANVIRGLKRQTSEDEWVARFRKSGMFPEDVYSFKRVNSGSREFYVTCNVCGGEPIISDRSNLVAGKVPCSCNPNGFDPDRKSYFYLHRVSSKDCEFFKFGITNFPHRRRVGLLKILNNVGCSILESRLFTGDGVAIQELERSVKSSISEKFIDEWSFKTETCSVSSLAEVLNMVSKYHLVEVLE